MKIRIEVEVGPTELREFLGLPDVAGVQQEALDALVHKLRSGAASGSDAIAILRGMMPESLTSLGDWQRLIARALQTGRPVTVETTVTPGGDDGSSATTARRPSPGKKPADKKKKQRTARKKTS
jgi:hypothetical protein